MKKQSVNDAPATDSEMHRLRNELYSATLALRAIATLLERGEVDPARDTAVKTLQRLAGDA